MIRRGSLCVVDQGIAAAFDRGREDAALRRAPKFRKADDGCYERLASLLRGWVTAEDPVEAKAYCLGYAKGKG